MKIFYDNKSHRWYHTSFDEEITMGFEKNIVPQKISSSGSYSFQLNNTGGHVGPLIGIMTARNENGIIAGNGPLFINLQKKLISLNGISFIFTINDVKDDFIEGYTFLPQHHFWQKMIVPIPDLVYNRIPFRKSEEDKKLQSFLSYLKRKNIPFFNPCFIDKFEFYQLFQSHSILNDYLPITEKVIHKGSFYSFFNKYHSVYLKPSQSARGKGIYLLRQEGESEIILEGLYSIQRFSSFEDFWREWGTILQSGNYIVQEKIQSLLYNGNRFDFRILAHAEKETYCVTGVGIRQSQGIELTTHVPYGGKILPYELLQTKEHDLFIKKAVEQIGSVLSEHLGFFGEFSIDAGISVDGKYYIYEVNSKPMSFDENEIEEKKINQLCHLFFQLTNFKSTNV